MGYENLMYMMIHENGWMGADEMTLMQACERGVQ
jgi:hypothetical protein